MTVGLDEKQNYFVPEKSEKMYLSIFPPRTPPYFKTKLRNNHPSGDRYKVVADTLTFPFHATSTHSRRHSQYIHVSVDGTYFKCLLFMTSYNTSYLGLRPVASK